MTVLAVTPLCAIFHQISAPHSVCEHGQLVESSDNRLSVEDWARMDAPRALGEVQRAPTSEIGAGPDSAMGGHNHCSVGTLAKNNVGLLPGTQVVAALSDVLFADLRHSEVAYVKTILLSAPKTSPPHVVS